MPRSITSHGATPGGHGAYHDATLYPAWHVTPSDLETRPEWVQAGLYRRFNRKFFTQWYRTKKFRYEVAMLSIEARVEKGGDTIEIVKWSKTHSVTERTRDFFDAATAEIVEFMVNRPYRNWYIHTLIISMWRGRGKSKGGK